MELIREILASHASGISRDGLLAWARLRGDPTMTDAQLDAALAALGDDVLDAQGFLYLRENAPPGATTVARWSGAGAADAAVPPTPRETSSPGAAPTPPPPPPAGWGAAPTPPPPPPAGWDRQDAAAPPAWAPAPPPADQWTTSEPVAPGEPSTEAPAWSAPEAPAWATPDGSPWPAPQASGRRTMLVAGVAVAGFVVLAGVASFLMRAADDTTPVETPTSGTVIGAETLQVGDCVILPSEDTFDELRRLACDEPHDGEIFFVGDHPDGDFPGDDGFEAFVTASCEPAFASYTGSDFYAQDVLEFGWFTPTEGSWSSGDREVSCYLTPANGIPTTTSYRGANP